MGGGQSSVHDSPSFLIPRPYEDIFQDIKTTITLHSVTSYEYPRSLIIAEAEKNARSNKPRRFGSYKRGRKCCQDKFNCNGQCKTCVQQDPSDTTAVTNDDVTPIDAPVAAATDWDSIPLPKISTEYVDLYTSLGTFKHDTTNDNQDLLRKEKLHSVTKNSILKSCLATDSLIEIPVFGNKSNHKAFLEPQIFLYLLPFIMDSSLPLCLTVCPHWFVTIYSYLQQLVNPILDDFSHTYQNYLHLVTSTFSIQPLYTAETSVVRIDVLLYAKILPKCVKECIQFGYAFEYKSLCLNCRAVDVILKKDSNNSLNEKEAVGLENGVSSEKRGSGKCDYIFHEPPAILPPVEGEYDEMHSDTTKKIYKSLFRFEACKKNSRRHIWFQRDVCRFHGDELMIASFPSVPTLNVGDLLEIPVNLSNALGIVCIPSIQWISAEKIRDPIEREFGQKCEIDQQQPWLSLDTFQPTTSERIQLNDFFEPQWKHLKTEFSGIDIIYSRSSYIAQITGEVPSAQKWLGSHTVVKSSDSQIVYPLSRLGLQHDRFTTHQLRRGDYVTVYMSQGGGVVI